MLLHHRHLFAKPMAGGRWQYWGTYDSPAELVEALDDVNMSSMLPKIVVSHVQPEALLVVINRVEEAYERAGITMVPAVPLAQTLRGRSHHR